MAISFIDSIRALSAKRGEGQKQAWRELGGLYRQPGIRVSFEFFPPKTIEAEQNLWPAAQKLASLQPGFMTVTYGAGGSTRAKTQFTAKAIQDLTGIPMAAHLTCVAASKGEVNTVADALWQDGIRHLIALRGDMPGGGAYVPHADGYQYTSDLVAGLKRLHNFEISVAAYPEKHPDAPDLNTDLQALKRKLDAGADRAITQFFFEPATYMRFLEQARAIGITQPIVPGILPINSFSQVQKFAAQCGARIPDSIAENFAGLDDDAEVRKLIAAVTAAEQCQVLAGMGVRHFHFYTLNRADLVYAVCHLLGLRPKAKELEAPIPATSAIK
jgi:methylenetetrahydrofolate reductase (NADPH)